MSNDEATYGPGLYRYIERHWLAEGSNRNAWCDAHPGMQAPTLVRWSKGTAPDVVWYRRVADALGKPILDVLVGSGVITEGEANGYAVAEPSTSYSSFLDAVARDPELTERERETYPEMRAAFAEIASGQAASVETELAKSGRPVTRRKRPR